MRRLFLICTGLAVSCQSPPAPRVVRHVEAHEYVRPDVKPVTIHVHEASAGTGRAAVQVAAAQAATKLAQTQAQIIIAEGVAAHSAQAEELAANLGATQAALFRAEAELRDTADQLAQAGALVLTLDAKVTEQGDALAKVETARVVAVNHGADLSESLATEQQAHRADNTTKDGEISHQTRLAWKWRLATGGLAGGALLFLLRKPLGMLCGIRIP